MIRIVRMDGADAYDLIFTPHLAMLPEIEQETMHRAMRNSSRLWVGYSDETILAVWGLIPPTLLSDTAYLWQLTTKHMTDHVFLFIRHSQIAVADMLTEYPTIVGHTRTNNRRAIRWLRWLGAVFGDPINNDFLPFTIKATQSWHQDSAQSA